MFTSFLLSKRIQSFSPLWKFWVRWNSSNWAFICSAAFRYLKQESSWGGEPGWIYFDRFSRCALLEVLLDSVSLGVHDAHVVAGHHVAQLARPEWGINFTEDVGGTDQSCWDRETCDLRPRSTNLFGSQIRSGADNFCDLFTCGKDYDQVKIKIISGSRIWTKIKRRSRSNKVQT